MVYVSPIKLGLLKVYLLVGILKNGSNVNSIFIKAKTMYKILSLDGGGSWAVIQAACLGKIYGNSTPGRQILSHFNLVVANSGGSLILAGLALNLSPAQIMELLGKEEWRKRIFKNLPWYKRLKQVFLGMGPKYEAEAKRLGLAAALQHASGEDPNVPLTDLKTKSGLENTDFLICTFDYDQERASFMRSNLRSNSGSASTNSPNTNSTAPIAHNSFTLLDAIHSASHAPVNFFEKVAWVSSISPKGIRNEHRHWDGAVGGYNNPVLAGLTEALVNGINIIDIRILSIGTGLVRKPLDKDFPVQAVQDEFLFDKTGDPSMLRDIPKMAMSILADPPDSASYISHVFLHKENLNPIKPFLIRLNPMIAPIWNVDTQLWYLPKGYLQNEAAFNRISSIEMDAVSKEDFDTVCEAMQLWLEDLIPNQGIQYNRYLKVRIGQDSFSQAAKAWQEWD